MNRKSISLLVFTLLVVKTQTEKYSQNWRLSNDPNTKNQVVMIQKMFSKVSLFIFL